MNIAINIVEIASELATERTHYELLEKGFKISDIYPDDDNIVEYSEVAQKVFNEWYDFYYSNIDKYKIKVI